jgi:hypothetical protein
MKVVRHILVASFVAACPIAAAAQEHAAEHGADVFPVRFTVRGFSDFTFREEQQPASGGGRTVSTFNLGQTSLFLSARIAENITIVSETAFKLGSDVRRSQIVELERVYIKYVVSDAFKIAAGRTHTALGYWNEAFHHGALLHPTVERPEILRFGGVMPVHSVGLELSGRVPAGGWDISYVGNIANGRGREFTATMGASDLNTTKAVAVKLSFAHEGEQTIILGPMIYRDVVPPDPADPRREAALTETIPGAHFVLRDARFELLSEYFHIRHTNQSTATHLDHTGWYAIAIIRPWRWKPYAGADVARFAAGDAYFAGSDTSVRRYLGGLRFDLNPLNALKFEYRREHRTTGVTHAFVVNTAFAF